MRSVYCPLEAGTVTVSQCLRCARLAADEGDALVCYALERAPEPEAIVSDALAPVVVCVDEDLQLEELRALFDEKRLQLAPVVEDEGVLLGVVSRSDVEQVPVPEHSRAWHAELTAEELMRTKVETLSESASIHQAIERLGSARSDALPVVTRNNIVVGTLSRAELLRYLVEH